MAEKQFFNGKFIEYKDFIFDVDLIMKNEKTKV